MPVFVHSQIRSCMDQHIAQGVQGYGGFGED